jgi:hypothetical protein
MKEELDKQLCEKYPKIFRDRHAPMNETCMCWGIAVGDGWYNIIDRLCALIQWRIDQRIKNIEYVTDFHNMRDAALAGDWTLFDQKYKDHKPEWVEHERNQIIGPPPAHWAEIPKEIPQVVAAQVKEKFGGLRFYIDGGDDEIHAYIQMAEAIADVTCEECGAPGKKQPGGWIVTLCDKHAKVRNKKLAEREAEIKEFNDLVAEDEANEAE